MSHIHETCPTRSSFKSFITHISRRSHVIPWFIFHTEIFHEMGLICVWYSVISHTNGAHIFHVEITSYLSHLCVTQLIMRNKTNKYKYSWSLICTSLSLRSLLCVSTSLLSRIQVSFVTNICDPWLAQVCRWGLFCHEYRSLLSQIFVIHLWSMTCTSLQ